MSNAEQKKLETIAAASKNPVRLLTVAELEVVSGGDGGPGTPPVCGYGTGKPCPN
jgi:hypothetical protein